MSQKGKEGWREEYRGGEEWSSRLYALKPLCLHAPVCTFCSLCLLWIMDCWLWICVFTKWYIVSNFESLVWLMMSLKKYLISNSSSLWYYNITGSCWLHCLIGIRRKRHMRAALTPEWHRPPLLAPYWSSYHRETNCRGISSTSLNDIKTQRILSFNCNESNPQRRSVARGFVSHSTASGRVQHFIL